MQHITVCTHYDKDENGLHGDYRYVTITINGTEVRRYGDEYHDRGLDKARGFVDGYKSAVKDVVIDYMEDEANY